MATKKEPQAANHDRAKLIGTIIGAVIVSLLSSGALNKLADDDVKEDVQKDVNAAVKGSDIGTALYLAALRDALEARYRLQESRIEALEKSVQALQATGTRSPASVATELPRLAPPESAPLPSFEVR